MAVRRRIARRRDDRDRMADLIDDALLDAIAIAVAGLGADRLRAWEGVAERVVLGVPQYGMSPTVSARPSMPRWSQTVASLQPQLGARAAKRTPCSLTRLRAGRAAWV
jgi:hypothetical protein